MAGARSKPVSCLRRTGFRLACAALTFGLFLLLSSPSAMSAVADSCGIGGRAPLFGLASGTRQLAPVPQARTRLSFRPLLLSGRPFRIYVTRESQAVHRRLTVVYRSSAGRRYALSQGRAWETWDEHNSFVRAMDQRSSCGARSSAIRLQNESLALFVEAADRRVLNFRVGRVELLGDPANFSRQRALALANLLSRSS